AMGWKKEGIEFLFKVDKKFEEAFYPDVVRGDSVEIFIDTRNVKTSGYNTRFCHHFFFLPEAVEGHQAGELTHFRTEDVHELCDPSELKIKAQVKTNQYTLHIWIPRECLYGYDPEPFDRLGFSYRINRPYWESQHFSVVTEDYQLEQQPSLWSSLRLVK
ncbi:MAG: sugar-binding protein, partial [Waddliaceae bacterium]